MDRNDQIKELIKTKSATEIGKMFGISRERVRQICGGSVRKTYWQIKKGYARFLGIRHIKEALFWEKVEIGNSTDCWPWKQRVIGMGYGYFYFNGEHVYAHRVAWELANGPIPPGTQCVMHLCNNPRCCNPYHLKPGTDKENAAMREDRYKNGEIERPYKKNGVSTSSRVVS